MKKTFLILTSLLVIAGILISSCAPPPATQPPQPTANDSNSGSSISRPPAPPFDSGCQVADEGKVMPVDKKPERPLKIAVLGLENNPFWIPVKAGTLAAAETLKEYNTIVEWIVPGDDHTARIFGNAIETAITQKYDAIATIAGDAGMVPYINKAVEAGIPVATFDSETATENKRLFFMGGDEYTLGRTAGEAMAKALDGKGKVAIITGFLAVEAHELRRQGFEDYLKENAPGIEIVGVVENQDKADLAFTQAKDFMTAYPDLAGIYVTAGGPFGAAKAVEDSGKTDVVQVISFDMVDETMEFVKKGVIYATIALDPFNVGRDPAIRLYNYLVGNIAPECGKLFSVANVVTSENMDQFYKPAQ